MKKELIQSRAFLCGLVLLILNDFYLKSTFGNLLTGKLSDFSGLFVFPIFWYSIFPSHKNKVFLLTALGFIYWKSEYSEFFIESWNSLIALKVSRVIDYSDLFALVVLPLAYRFENLNYKSITKLRFSPLVIIGVTMFAFASTSAHTEIELEEKYEFRLPMDSLEQRIIHLEDVKSYYYISSRDSLVENKMKLELNIEEDFCFDGYNALISISGDSIHSLLTLESFNHGCPQDGADFFKAPDQNDHDILLNSFELKIVEKLK